MIGGDVVTAALLTAFCVSIFVLATFPQWFIGSVTRSRLADLRDDLQMCAADGAFLDPRNDEALRELNGLVTHACMHVDELTPFALRRMRRAVADHMDVARVMRLDELAARERQEFVGCFDDLKVRYCSILLRQSCIGSWSGMAATAEIAVRRSFRGPPRSIDQVSPFDLWRNPGMLRSAVASIESGDSEDLSFRLAFTPIDKRLLIVVPVGETVGVDGPDSLSPSSHSWRDGYRFAR
jgi:hypothetical protein